MTTYHHTEIVTGESNAPATINTRLGTIDAAIGELATSGVPGASTAAQVISLRNNINTLTSQLNSLVIDSGTSDAETIAARGSYSTVAARLTDMTPKASILYVDATFASDQASHGRYNDITTAMSAATAGTTIYVAPGVYSETVTFGASNIKLIGMGQPGYDSGTGRLVGGTILRGRIRMGAHTGLVIQDLGVDLFGVDNLDCIESSNLIETPVRRTIKNVTLLGNGYDALGHGIYASGDYIQVDNVRIIRCHHGIAIHGRYGNFNNIILESCSGSSIIIKSKASTGAVQNINVNNVSMWGDDTSGDFDDWAGPFIVQAADGETTKGCNISNVTAHCCVNGVVQTSRLAASGTVEDIHFVNVHSNYNQDLAVVGDFWFRTGDNIVLTNCSSSNRESGNGWNFDTTADNLGDVYVINATDDASGTGTFIGSPARFQCNGVEQVDTTYRVTKYKNRQSSTLGGYIPTSSISVTGSNVDVASISGPTQNSTSEGFSGLILVHVRNNTTTSSNIASYMLWVHRAAHEASGTATVVSSAGLTSGAGSSFPSFTWSVDATNNRLRASVVGSTTGSFFFSFTALGNIKVSAL